MTQQLSPIEQLSHSTVRIECDFPDGSQGTGTGFFYSLSRDGKKHVPVIITNKHVIEGSSNGRFILTLRRSDGGPDYGNNKSFEFRGFASMWQPHPDVNVDLCAMPIANLMRKAKSQGHSFFFVNLENSLIPTDS